MKERAPAGLSHLFREFCDLSCQPGLPQLQKKKKHAFIQHSFSKKHGNVSSGGSTLKLLKLNLQTPLLPGSLVRYQMNLHNVYAQLCFCKFCKPKILYNCTELRMLSFSALTSFPHFLPLVLKEQRAIFVVVDILKEKLRWHEFSAQLSAMNVCNLLLFLNIFKFLLAFLVKV